MSKAYTDVVRFVGDEQSGGAAIKCGPGPDGFGVTIEAATGLDKEYFGEFSLTVSKEIAEQLGHALIAASKECEG